ncbi:MAG TPA: hypothetical protein VIF44_03960, partial [Candidatus Limnocylindrales bacterium]
DYFFQPAVALIYVVFVVLFLVGRALAGETRLTEREALANALDLLEVRLESPLEEDDRARIEELLDRAGTQPGLVPAIRSYIRGLPERPDHEAWWELIPRWFAEHYRRIAADPRFSDLLTAAVILYTVAVVIGSLLVVIAARRTDSPMTVATIAQVASTLAGAALVTRGVVALPTSRAAAYRWFIRGILVWLLLTQVFVFYSSQLLGLGGLAVNLAAYIMLRYALGHEAVGGQA